MVQMDNSGFYLHASSVEISGKALIFLGHSTAGKSTIAGILSKKYPIISDDKIFVSKKKNIWMIKNGDDVSFSSGEKNFSFSTNVSFPILSFVRIFKSNSNKISEIGQSLLCKYIIDAVFEVNNQRNIEDINVRKKWFSLSAELSRENSGWNFDFIKNDKILTIIEKTFEK